MAASLKKDIFPCAILVAFWVFLFRSILFENHLLFGNDFNAFYLGMKQFLFNEIHEHHSIPYWNPYIFGGIPFWAHFESTIFYPLGFLFWIFSPSVAYGYTMFIHLVLAALFMYGLARSLSIGRIGSVVSGAVFSCNGFITSLLYLGHLSPVMSYPWLPLVILFFHRALNSDKPAWNAALAGLFWSIQILAGAPQDAFYTYLAALFIGLSRLIFPAWGSVAPLRTGACLGLLFLTGVCLAAIQVIPGFELVQESVRATQDSYQQVTSRSLPPAGIFTAMAPHFFWDPGSNFTWLKNMPYSMPQENLYAGVLPLFLLFIPAWGMRDRGFVFFTLGLVLIGLLLAMGYHTPLYKVVCLIPGFDKFRSPTRIIVLWMFGMALWAGKGLDIFVSRKIPISRMRTVLLVAVFIFLVLMDILIQLDPSPYFRFFSSLLPHEAVPERMFDAERMITEGFHRFILFGGAVLFLFLLIRRTVFQARSAAWLLCGLLLLDLGQANGRSIQVDDQFPKKVVEAKRTLDQSIADKGLFRVGVFASPLGPNFEMALGYQSVGGFTALILQRYWEYTSLYSEHTLPQGWQYCFYGRHFQKALMDLLNVKYEIYREQGEIFLRDTALPRAFIIPECVVEAKADVLRAMTSPEFDPTRTVVLETGNCESAHYKGNESAADFSRDAKAEVMYYRPDDIRVRISSPSPAYLFFSEVYYPGWKAFIDGVPADILRGNYIFRVIPVPEGNHVVDLSFRPGSIKAGIAVSLITLLLLAFFGVLGMRKRKSGFHKIDL